MRVSFVNAGVAPEGLNERLSWFASSIGLLSDRDKDKSCFRLFIELLKSGKHDVCVTSDELAVRLNLTRATVVHHLNSLKERGVVVSTSKGYCLRAGSLSALVSHLEEDALSIASGVKTVAQDIDKELGLSGSFD